MAGKALVTAAGKQAGCKKVGSQSSSSCSLTALGKEHIDLAQTCKANLHLHYPRQPEEYLYDKLLLSHRPEASVSLSFRSQSLCLSGAATKHHVAFILYSITLWQGEFRWQMQVHSISQTI